MCYLFEIESIVSQLEFFWYKKKHFGQDFLLVLSIEIIEHLNIRVRFRIWIRVMARVRLIKSTKQFKYPLVPIQA